MPRTPKPPGTQTASTPPSACCGARLRSAHSSEATQRMRDLGVVGEAAGAQRLGDREVGVGQVDVLADQGDRRPRARGGAPGAAARPSRSSRRRGTAGRGGGRRRRPGPRGAAPWGCRRCSARRRRLTTASTSTSHISEILRLIALGDRRGRRGSTIASGWMPTWRSAATECWVGLVFSSPRRADVGHQRDVQEEARCRGRCRGAPGGRPRGTAATRCRRRCRRSR